jgi:hypothetical protein
MTPDQVHYGQAKVVHTARQDVLFRLDYIKTAARMERRERK